MGKGKKKHSYGGGGRGGGSLSRSSYSAPVARGVKAGGQRVPPEPAETLRLPEPVVLRPLSLHDTFSGRERCSGLRNLGNTCFFNAALQCLCSVDSFRSFMTAGSWTEAPAAPPRAGHAPPFPPIGEGPVTRAARSVFSAMASAAPGSATNPGALLEELGRINPRFRSRAQQDSQELLRTLVDSMDEEEQHRVRLRRRRREDLLASLAAAGAAAASEGTLGGESGRGAAPVTPAAGSPGGDGGVPAAAGEAAGSGAAVTPSDAQRTAPARASGERTDGEAATAPSAARPALASACAGSEGDDEARAAGLAAKRASAVLGPSLLARLEAAASWEDDEEAEPAPAGTLVPNELDAEPAAVASAAAPAAGEAGTDGLIAPASAPAPVRGARPGGVPTWVWRLMGMRLCSMVRCAGCGRVSSTVETAFDLSVPLPPAADTSSASRGGGAGGGGAAGTASRLSKRERRQAGREAAKMLRSAAARRGQRKGGGKDGSASDASTSRGKHGRDRGAADGKGRAKAGKGKLDAGSAGAAPDAADDAQLAGGVQRPSEAWLKRASKRDLLQWLWGNAPPSLLLQRGLSPASNLKRLAGRVIAAELIDAVHEAVDALTERAAKPGAPADAESASSAADGAAASAAPPSLPARADAGSQTTATEWTAGDVAASAAAGTMAGLLVAVERRVQEEEAAAAASAAVLDAIDRAMRIVREGEAAPDPAELAAEAARAAVPEVRAELPDGLVVPPCPRAKPGSRSLRACLAAFAAEDELSVAAGNGYRCEACAAAWVARQAAAGVADAKPSAAPLQDATKRMVVLDPPHVLSVHVKRFAVSARGMPVKRADHVTLPRVLNLAPLCALSPEEARRGQDLVADEAAEAARARAGAASAAVGRAGEEPQPGAAATGAGGATSSETEPGSVPDPLARAAESRAPVRYALKGVVVHQGASLSSGHYVAAARCGSGWVHASDTNVHSTSEASALAQQAYMCLYERVA